MAFTLRLAASSLAALAAVTALAPLAAADPDIDGESASSVISQLQEQGYTVSVDGVPSGDATKLTACVVTKINGGGGVQADPTTTSPVSVEVACPITRG